MLVANPVPEEYAMPEQEINAAIEKALQEVQNQSIKGKEITPFLLSKIVSLTDGKSLETNIRLVLNNAALAARIAACL
jgi:pseudouridine-5'-phosphate glycosidase